MSVVSLRASLLAKLNAMQGLKAAYDWETSNPGGNYPFATVTLRTGAGEVLSSSHNKRIRGFTIRVYQERSKGGQGPEQAERITAELIDEFEAAFDMDTTLSGTCKFVEPVDWRATYIDRELDIRILEYEINAIEVVNSYPV